MDLEQSDQEEIATRLQSGDLCPSCLQGRMNYNGLLNLECDKCKYTVGGFFT